MTENTLFAYFDLSIAPATFDIMTFLYIAEIDRIDRGLDQIELRIVANTGGGFRNASHRGLNHVQGSNPTQEDLRNRLDNILMPAARLLPSCQRVVFLADRAEAKQQFDPGAANFPHDFTIDNPKITYFESSILMGQYFGKQLGTLKAPAEAADRAGRWLDAHTNGKRAVVITIRDLPYHPLRNSNVAAWSKFAKSLDKDKFCPIFVRDTEHTCSPVRPELADFAVCDEAALDLEFRMGLYECAYLNLAVSGGPILLCMLNKTTRYIRFKMLAKDNPHGGPALYYSIGLEPGASFSHGTTFQELIWEDDDYETIASAFSAMVDRIETEKLARRRELPPVLDTAKRFTVGGNNDDAETICRTVLRDDPQNFEFQYLLATVLQNTDRHEEALTILEKLRTLAGDIPTILVPTVSSLYLTGRGPEARELAHLTIDLIGDDKNLLQWIGRIMVQMGEDSAGRKALTRMIELSPHESSPHVDLARHYHGNNISVPRAIRHFEKSIELGQPDPLLPLELADCYARMGDLKKAAFTMKETLDKTGFTALNSLIPMGITQRLADDTAAAQLTFTDALETIQNLLVSEDEKSVSYTDILAGEAQTLILLDRIDEARASLKRSSELRPPSSYIYGTDCYLPDTPARLARLKEIVRARDIMLFCHGPSIGEMNKWWPRFEEFDACLFAVNKFKVFESGFLQPSNRHIDAIVRSHHQDIKASIDQVVEYLSRPEDNVMFTAHWAMNKIGGAGIDRSEIDANFSHKMIYFGAAEGWLCAAPNQPLHLKQGNALSALLTFAVISEPRRIFIFGADGGVEASGATTTHYGADNKDFRLEIDDEKHTTMAATLRADTAMFDIYSNINLMAVENLFGVKRPEIYNVSPGSAIKSLPCIDYESALRIMGESSDE